MSQLPESRETAAPLVTVLIPAFNEAGMLEKNLASIHAGLCGLAPRFRTEILVIDDGSDDATWEIAGQIAAQLRGIRRVRHSTNLGLGQALRTGFAQATGDYVVVLDADLSYDTGHIEQLLEALIENHAQVSVVSPYMKGGRVSGVPRYRALLSRWANWFLAFFAPHADVRTLTSMVRAYDGDFLRGMNLRAVGVDINTEILYKTLLLRGRIIEVPAHLDWTLQNQSGIGRVSSFKIARSVVAYVLAGFIFRPFMFFVLPGIALSLVALYVLVWTSIDVISVYGSAPPHPSFKGELSAALAEVFRARPHSFFIGGFASMLSLQLVSLGFIAYQSKRYFEELFHISSSIRRQAERSPSTSNEVECCEPPSAS
jgi:glycosyltransferase involved in cell wall biosynthesis